MSVAPLDSPVGGGETVTETKDEVGVKSNDGNDNYNSRRRRANVFNLDEIAGADLMRLEESVERFDWEKVSDFAPLLLSVLWIFIGTVFYTVHDDLGWARGLFMSVNAGWSIGWPMEGLSEIDTPLSKLFTIYHTSTGVLFAGVTVLYIAEEVGKNKDNWIKQIIKVKERDVAAESDECWEMLRCHIRLHWPSFRIIFLFLIWFSFGLLWYPFTNTEYSVAKNADFMLSTLTGGGYLGLPDSIKAYQFVVTSLYTTVGLPLLNVALGLCMSLIMESPEDNFVFQQIVAPVTWEEISFMQEFEIEDGDGTIDCKEFMILAVVRIGSISPELIRRISERFQQLDRKRLGKIAYDDLIVGRRKPLRAEPTNLTSKSISGDTRGVVVSDDISSVRFSRRTSVSYKARNNSVFANRAKSVFAAGGSSAKSEIESNIDKIRQLTQNSTRLPVNQLESDSRDIEDSSREQRGDNSDSDDKSDVNSSDCSGSSCSHNSPEREDDKNYDRKLDEMDSSPSSISKNTSKTSAEGRIKKCDPTSCNMGMVVGPRMIFKPVGTKYLTEMEQHDPSPVLNDSSDRKKPGKSPKARSHFVLITTKDRDSTNEPSDDSPEFICGSHCDGEDKIVNGGELPPKMKDEVEHVVNVSRLGIDNNKAKNAKVMLAMKQKYMSQRFVTLAQQVRVENNVEVKSEKHNKLQQAKNERGKILVEAHERKKKRRMERIVVQFVSFAKSYPAFTLYAWLLWLSAGAVFYYLEEDLTVDEAIYVSTSIGYGIFWHELTSSNTYAKVYTCLHFSIGVFGVAFAMAVFARHLVTMKKKWFNDMKQQRLIRVALTTEELWDDVIALFEYYWPKVYVHFFFVLWMVLGIVWGVTSLQLRVLDAWLFSMTAMATGGLVSLPSSGVHARDYVFYSIFIAVGAPLMAISCGVLAHNISIYGKAAKMMSKINAPMTEDELVMMNHLDLEDDDGYIDRAEFVILILVRIGALNPDLISVLFERFYEIDTDGKGNIAYDALVNRQSFGYSMSKLPKSFFQSLSINFKRRSGSSSLGEAKHRGKYTPRSESVAEDDDEKA